MTYLLRRRGDLGGIAAVTLQMAECSEHRTDTTHVKAGNPQRAKERLVAQRRNVRGRGSSREGQSADDMQVVEGKGSCKRVLPVHKYPLGLWIRDGAPTLVCRRVRRLRAAPSPLRCCNRTNSSGNGTCAGSGGQ
jgi:hypothetical protein